MMSFPRTLRLSAGIAILVGSIAAIDGSTPQQAVAQVATCDASPAPDCRRSEKSRVTIRQKGGAIDKLSWKAPKGDATDLADFGDPLATAGYAVCVYAGSQSTLVAEASVPADPTAWSPLGTKGYRYKDSTSSADGIQKIILKAGTDGKTKVSVKGKGINLPDPTLPVALPLRVQLINSETTACWEDLYDGTDIRRNDIDQLKAKAGEEIPGAPLPVLRTPDPLPFMTASEAGVPDFVGSPVADSPIPPLVIPAHPFLNNTGDSRIHNDHYNSAVYNRDGPRGISPVIKSATLYDADAGDLGMVCAMLTFTEDGHVVGVCLRINIPDGSADSILVMLDPDTLDVYAETVVQPRPLVLGPAGGAYFSIDHKGRYVIGPANNHVEIWELTINGNQPQFVRVASYDVSMPLSPDDLLQDTVVDYDGRLWFVSVEGIIGYYDPATDVLETFDIGEELQNSLAVDSTGVYVVTYDAMHKFSVDTGDGTVVQDWRTPYDNSGPGILQPGSGTTPTLFGQFDDLVGFADTATPQINMVVLDRATGATVCLTPIFRPNESGAENTFLTYEDEVVVVNNGGFTSPFGPQNTIFPGLEKYEVRSDRTGCDVVWVNDTSIGNSAQLSTTTGLIYGWGADPAETGLDAFYLTANDWATGAEVWRVYTGNDRPFNPVVGQPHLHPNGTAYVGSLYGIISVADGP